MGLGFKGGEQSRAEQSSGVLGSDSVEKGGGTKEQRNEIMVARGRR